MKKITKYKVLFFCQVKVIRAIFPEQFVRIVVRYKRYILIESPCILHSCPFTGRHATERVIYLAYLYTRLIEKSAYIKCIFFLSLSCLLSFFLQKN